TIRQQPVPPATVGAPLGEAVVQIRDPATNSTVMNVISAADGTYLAPASLSSGNYQIVVFATGYATQWAFAHGNQAAADSVQVVVGGTAVPDIVMSSVQGSISGRVFRSDGTTPLADAGV